MSNWNSTETWKQVEFPAVQPIIGSNQTFRLELPRWPPWAQHSTQMQRLWVYCPDEENAIAVPGSTATVLARILSERHDAKDEPRPYNYNFYLFAQTTDGRLFQSPPIRTSLPPHHSSEPPAWLDAYGPPPF